jgi:LmbE family N-acetylglucosaminyl deacetylase
MNTPEKVYILSPHFDDAAYGLTLTISQLISRNIPVTIINCFTITKWTALPVENKDVRSVSLLRAAEDAAYNKLFNNAINLVNLDLLDAPLRNGYIFQSSSFAPNEWELVEELKNYLMAHVNGVLLCPLGIGNHIDHAICREAVVQLYKKLEVIFYEDLPYAQRITEEQLVEHIRKLEEALEVKLTTYTSPLNQTPVDKEQAIKVYKSQLNDEICSEIIARMQTLQGERVWGEEEIIETLKRAMRSC